MKKTMLHRSFKPAKCKTALKLAVSRIKLLKNKIGAHVKVLKRELAQLLGAGQDRTARIRVEHMLVEEKMVTAYELIEIYCELIAARIPIIESQKNCPIDLKEAIASVIYASPRCADLPELQDVGKQLKAKYGKEFVAAALELRPNCGVSRMLVEKLSAKAPDGPTKMKILSGIAEEHNIKWDPKSSEEKEVKPPDDLLNGPNTFEKSTKMHAEPPGNKTPSNQVEKEPPSNCNPPGQHAEHDAYPNFHQQNSNVSPRSQNFVPHVEAYNTTHHTSHPEVRLEKEPPSNCIPPDQHAERDADPKFHQKNSSFSPRSQDCAPHVDAYNTTHHNSHPECRTSGNPVEGSEYGHSHSGVFEETPKTDYNWNMDFKDAAEAARAAAESAERASFAARAAVELSSRGQTTTQYSIDPQSSPVRTRRDEVSQDSFGRNKQDEHATVFSQHRQTSSRYSTDSQSTPVHTKRDEMSQDSFGRNMQDEQATGLSQHRQTSSRYSMDSQNAPIHTRRDEVSQDSFGRNKQDEHATVFSQHRQTSSRYSTDSQSTPVHTRRDEVSQDSVVRNMQGEQATVLSQQRQTSNRYSMDSQSSPVRTRRDEVSQDSVVRNMQGEQATVLSQQRQTSNRYSMDSQSSPVRTRRDEVSQDSFGRNMQDEQATELSQHRPTSSRYSMDSQNAPIYTRRDEVSQDSFGRNMQDEQATILSQHRQTPSRCSTDSQSSPVHTRRDEMSQDFIGRNLQDEHATVFSQHRQTSSRYSTDSQSTPIHTRRHEVSQDSIGRNMQDEQAKVHSQHTQTARQYSMDSQFTSTGNRRDESTQDYVDRKSQEEEPSEVRGSNNFHGNRDSVIQYKNSDDIEQDDSAGVGARFHGDISKTSETTGSSSFKRHPTTVNDDSMRNPFWMEDNDASENSIKPEKIEHVSDMEYGVNCRNIDTSIQQGIETQPNHVPYTSQSAYSSKYREVWEPKNEKIGNYSGNKSFVDFHQDEYQERTVEEEAYDKKSVAFDDSGSDSDIKYTYDMMGQSDHTAEHSYGPFSFPDRVPSTHIPETKSSSSTSKHINDSPKTSTLGSKFSINQHLSPVFSDSFPVNSSQSDDFFPPAIFDDIDGPSSEEEHELHNFKLSGTRSRRGSLTKGRKTGSTGTSFIEEENARSKGKLQFQSSSSSLDPIEERHERYQENNELDGSSFNKAVKDKEHVQYSTSESSMELNLGMLRGGLKHRNKSVPLYLRNSSGNSTYKNSVEINLAESEPPSSILSVKTSDISEATYQDPYIRMENLTAKGRSFSTNAVTEFDSNDDNSGEIILKETSNITQQSHISRADSRVKEKSSSIFGLPHTYLDSDNDESAENLPKQNFASKGRLTTGISRRTRASKTSERIPSMVTPEASPSSPALKSLHKPQSPFRSSERGRKFEQPSSANQAAASKPVSESKSSLDDGNVAPPEKEQSTNKIFETASVSSEESKTSSSSGKNLTRINSTASHVHPKLPDFDSFIAHMKSLHKNRE